MRQKLFRWPIIVAAICGVFLFATVTPVLLPQPVHAQGQQDEESPTLECEILSANPANWIICPIVTGLQEAVNGMNAAIDALLTVDVNTLFGPTYKAAWDQFRIIAIGIIIIAGLVMVASQAFGFDFLDAYTVKKVMPRLIIAIIFIALSWDILRFLVTLSNDAGNSVRAIIYQPFKQSLGGSNFGTALDIGNWTTFVAALISGAAIVTLGLAALLSFVATALLAVFIGFLVLLGRQIIITMLVLVAPFAIACYVLPNTQKVFDFWKGTLLSMLVVFPIISAFIATGRVFALVAYNNGAGGGISVIQQMTAFAAFFLPYLALPFAFRLAGGAIATIAGLANDRGRGGFDRLKGYRQNKAAQNMADLKTGNRFNERSFKVPGAVPFLGGRRFSPGGRLNRMSAGAAMGVKGRAGFGEQGKAAAEQRDMLAAAAYSKTDQAQAAQYNDGLLQAQTYSSESIARERMAKDFGVSQAEAESSIKQAKANGGFGRAQQIFATQQLAATGTGYADMDQMNRTIARVSNGNESVASSLVGNMRSSADRAGRYDLKASYNTQRKLALEAMADTSGNYQVSPDKLNAAMIDAVHGADAMSRARAKPGASANSVKAINQALETAQTRLATTTDAGERANLERTQGELVATLQNMRMGAAYGPEAYSKKIYDKTDGIPRSQVIVERVTQEAQSYRPTPGTTPSPRVEGYNRLQQSRGGMDPAERRLLADRDDDH